jgi:thiol-disulfide isomerase/thioredoxin
MKDRYLYKILVAGCICFIISSCRKPDEFTVKGVVAGAAGQILYLENTGLSTTTVVDSVKLNFDGRFLLRHKRPPYPDFYRLSLNNHRIYFAVDSTETILFTADAHNFATSYTVEGSENSKAMKEITLAQLDAFQEIYTLRDSYGMNLIPDSIYQESSLKAIASYKKIALKYIFGAPASPAAYFALFQQIDGLWFFDLYDRTDSKAYGAVATGYKTHYPESPRAKQLESLALQSMRVTRGERSRNAMQLKDAKEVSFIDIDLPDINNSQIKLSDVAQGKTVLVNFTAYQTEWSPTFNMKLNELYDKYKDRGFEIYQVSLDNDAHFWKNVAANIPWIKVRDPQSIYSSIAAIYNVRQLPTLFLLNKKGEMVKRIETIDTIDDDIKSAL